MKSFRSASSYARLPVAVLVTVVSALWLSAPAYASTLTEDAATGVSISDVAPDIGVLAGDPVTITGANLANTDAVQFGDGYLPFTLVNNSTMIVHAPPNDAGTVPVRLLDSWGDTLASASYTYSADVTGPGVPVSVHEVLAPETDIAYNWMCPAGAPWLMNYQGPTQWESPYWPTGVDLTLPAKVEYSENAAPHYLTDTSGNVTGVAVDLKSDVVGSTSSVEATLHCSPDLGQQWRPSNTADPLGAAADSASSLVFGDYFAPIIINDSKNTFRIADIRVSSPSSAFPNGVVWNPSMGYPTGLTDGTDLPRIGQTVGPKMSVTLNVKPLLAEANATIEVALTDTSGDYIYFSYSPPASGITPPTWGCRITAGDYFGCGSGGDGSSDDIGIINMR